MFSPRRHPLLDAEVAFTFNQVAASVKFDANFMRMWDKMLNHASGVDSLTTFKRQTADYLKRLHETGEAVVLTVNGKAQIVVQDADAYQKLIEAVAKVEHEQTLAAIREGLNDVKAGRTKPAKKALKALAKKYGIESSGR